MLGIYTDEPERRTNMQPCTSVHEAGRPETSCATMCATATQRGIIYYITCISGTTYFLPAYTIQWW